MSNVLPWSDGGHPILKIPFQGDCGDSFPEPVDSLDEHNSPENPGQA